MRVLSVGQRLTPPFLSVFREWLTLHVSRDLSQMNPCLGKGACALGEGDIEEPCR